MTHEEEVIELLGLSIGVSEELSIKISEEAFQIGAAHNLATQLNISGHDDIDVEDILDCMAVAGCHLEVGGEISSKAYFKVLELNEVCNES